MKQEIYLDNAAATPVDPRVLRAMHAAALEAGNPSALHEAGRRAAVQMDGARATIAAFLNAHPGEIVFCASGSEANTLALIGLGGAVPGRYRHIISTPIEHPSVRRPIARLVQRGWSHACVPVDGEGKVLVQDVVSRITPRTAIVSVMYANNEIGVVQDIARIGRAIAQWRRTHKSRYPLFHVDACQAAAYLDMDVQRLGADLLTFNGSKIYGPRGVGVLYVRRGVALKEQVLGGDQEEGRRAGTENTPAIVGCAKALTFLKRSDTVRVSKLRDYFLARVSDVVSDIRINGPQGPDRLANSINISVAGADSENLLWELDQCGIRAASGSACTARALEPSHVLKAIGTPKRFLDGAIRISLSRHTTKGDMDRLLELLPGAVARARKRYLK